MHKKEQIIEQISEISRQRSKLDQLYVTLQKTLNSYKQSTSSTKSVVQMRENFTTLTSQISIKIIERSKQLDMLKYRCQKLTSQGQNMTSQQRNIQSLRDYFQDLRQNLSAEKSKGEQFISQKQRWELSIDGQNLTEQRTSLLNSNRMARDGVQMAEGMLTNLQNQENILIRTKNRMGDVLKNINLAANITMMVRTRSREDNKLIMWLTMGLVAEIFLCLFVIKPIFRGQ